jgi:hypothetical protein
MLEPKLANEKEHRSSETEKIKLLTRMSDEESIALIFRLPAMKGHLTLAFSCGARSASKLNEGSYLRKRLSRRQLQGFVGQRDRILLVRFFLLPLAQVILWPEQSPLEPLRAFAWRKIGILALNHPGQELTGTTI